MLIRSSCVSKSKKKFKNVAVLTRVGHPNRRKKTKGVGAQRSIDVGEEGRGRGKVGQEEGEEGGGGGGGEESCKVRCKLRYKNWWHVRWGV